MLPPAQQRPARIYKKSAEIRLREKNRLANKRAAEKDKKRMLRFTMRKKRYVANHGEQFSEISTSDFENFSKANVSKSLFVRPIQFLKTISIYFFKFFCS